MQDRMVISSKAHSSDALYKIVDDLPKDKIILDVGCGPAQPHAMEFRAHGFTVETADFFDNNTYIGDFNTIAFPKQFDVVWTAHCLEHQLNVQGFLEKIASLCKEDGYITITVPPLKTQIVGGHVSLWNAGLLLYRMVLAGLDCSNAHVKTYGYNISVIVKKKKITVPALKYDSPDLTTLFEYLPASMNWTQKPGKSIKSFDGDIQSLNWNRRL